MSDMFFSSESPCIGICSTVYGDNFCRGCKRNYLEVIDWNRYDDVQKQTINQRLQQQIESVMNKFIVVIDPEKLKTQLDQVALRKPIYQSALCWAYELLRLKSTEMKCLGDYGLQAKSPYETLTINGLFTQIDDCIYTLVNTWSAA